MDKFLNVVTMGKKHTDWQMPLVCNPFEELNSDTENIQSFRIVFIRQGTGIINTGGERTVFFAPVIYCLNETESFSAAECHNLSAQAVYFHPWVINSIFNYENIRQNGYGLSTSSSQDLFWFKPFLERSSHFCGQIPIGPLSVQKTANLLKAIIHQFVDQEDPDCWPCRGRSFLIELLFFLGQLYSVKEIDQTEFFPENSQGVDQIILYLYRNYQRKITIQELAEVFHTNRTSISNLFYTITGKTIHNYLINLRIQLASSLIRDTLLPLAEITERVGFGDLTHFTRTYRRLTGYTPSEYRQKFCWMLQYYPDFHD